MPDDALITVYGTKGIIVSFTALTAGFDRHIKYHIQMVCANVVAPPHAEHNQKSGLAGHCYYIAFADFHRQAAEKRCKLLTDYSRFLIATRWLQTYPQPLTRKS